MASTTKNDSMLLRLPPELRLLIYEYIFANPGILPLSSLNRTSHQMRWHGIALACHQTCTESIKLAHHAAARLYSDTIFLLDRESLACFGNIAEADMARISTRIIVIYRQFEGDRTLRILQPLRGIADLTGNYWTKLPESADVGANESVACRKLKSIWWRHCLRAEKLGHAVEPCKKQLLSLVRQACEPRRLLHSGDFRSRHVGGRKRERQSPVEEVLTGA